jgi:hypothetical protein
MEAIDLEWRQIPTGNAQCSFLLRLRRPAVGSLEMFVTPTGARCWSPDLDRPL